MPDLDFKITGVEPKSQEYHRTRSRGVHLMARPSRPHTPLPCPCRGPQYPAPTVEPAARCPVAIPRPLRHMPAQVSRASPVPHPQSGWQSKLEARSLRKSGGFLLRPPLTLFLYSSVAMLRPP